MWISLSTKEAIPIVASKLKLVGSLLLSQSDPTEECSLIPQVFLEVSPKVLVTNLKGKKKEKNISIFHFETKSNQ